MNTACVEIAYGSAERTSGARQRCLTVAGLAIAFGELMERFVGSADRNLGHLEAEIPAQAQGLLRQIAQSPAQ